jgi:hypothetical protein
MKGVGERHRTPFFNALRDYAKQPTGVFHALPLARGKSIMNSNWIGDLAEFYGMNLFMAETSATSGGLDSLLDPVGPLKLAQEYAARAFGAKRTYFATNGTSTWCGPTTSCWSTATATRAITTGSCSPVRRLPTSIRIRSTSSRCMGQSQSATSSRRCSTSARPARSTACAWCC